ncbi:hypothetical protein ACFLZ2_01970 [Candidatus Margulisiibacteriota bacterium]
MKKVIICLIFLLLASPVFCEQKTDLQEPFEPTRYEWLSMKIDMYAGDSQDKYTFITYFIGNDKIEVTLNINKDGKLHPNTIELSTIFIKKRIEMIKNSFSWSKHLAVEVVTSEF